LICDICLFFSSFSVSLLEHNLGFDTVLCSFLLSAAVVAILLIVNNSRISALSILAPTEYMVGIATGVAIGAAVLAAVLSSTYKTAKSQCSVAVVDGADNTVNATQHHNENEPNYEYMCKNMKTSFSAIWFWAGLSAWLNGVSAMLLIIGRHELSTAHHHYYETIGGSTTTPDFEEVYRRQQQEILGASPQQYAEIQQRAASMFVGDYSTIPEVTQGASVPSTPVSNSNRRSSNNKTDESAAMLSV
jgi:hypothetical protein